MENGYLATLSPKGQLTLPKELRKRLRLEEGGAVHVEQSGRGVLIRPAVVRPVDDEFEEKEWEILRKLAREKKGHPHKNMRSFLKSLKSTK